MTRSRSVIALALLLAMTVSLAPGAAVPAAAQARPEGEMRFAFYVTISPAGFDPGDVS